MYVWVFEGDSLPERRSHHPSAVFSSFENAKDYIGKYRLSGMLTRYTLDKAAFDVSVERGTVPAHQRDGALRQVWAGGEVHYHAANGRVLE